MAFFGYILLLSAGEVTYIFILLLMFLLIFKAALHIVETFCNRNGFKELLENLYREFMMMGLISFGVFISNEGYDYANSPIYLSFHFAHMVILFIGLAFILQALLLTGLVASRKGTLLRFSLISSSQLLDEYHDLMSSTSVRSFLFRNGPLSVSFPELREKIENRILKDFFIRSFNLPEEFNFAMYTCRALKSYVISLSEVRPFNWLILAVFAAINYAKVHLVDDKLKATHCFVFSRTEGSSSSYAATTSLSSDNSKPLFSSSDITENNSRNLASAEAYSEAEICREYFLSYSVFCAFMLTLFLVALLIVSEIYMRRLLEKVLEMEIDLEWQDVEEFEEEEALEHLANELQMQQIGMNGNDIKKETCAVVQDTIATQETAHLLPTLNPHQIPDKTAPTPKNPSPRTLNSDSTPGNSDGDTVPLVFSLQNPASMVTTQTHTEPPVSTASLPSTITSDSVSSPPLPVSQTVNGHHSPYADSYSRTRSVTSAPAHDGGMHPYRLTKAISGLGPVTERRRAASYSRARSTSFRHTDGSTPHSLRKSVSTTSGSFMEGDVRSEITSPRLPPESVIQEHAQQMKDIGRARSNTFIQYMSDSLPVSLMSSRFLYQKCLERICRAENNRHARNSKSGAETLSSFIASSRGSTNIPGEDQEGDDQDQEQEQGDVDVVLVTPSSSGKEGYERNPLQPTSHILRGGQVVGTGEGTGTGAGTGTVGRQRAGTMGSRHGSTGGTDATDSATRKSLTSRDSFRVNIANVSPRSSLTGGSGGSRQRSFTAESILHRAAFQSQSRSAKANSRENIDNQASSSSGDGCGTAQVNGQDHDLELEPSEEHSLESGYHHSASPKRGVSPRLRSPSTHLAGDSIWPTAEPETIGNASRPEQRTTKNTLVGVLPSQVQLTSENVKKSSITNGNRESSKGGERKEANDVTDKEVDKDDTLVNTVQVRTVSNTNIIAPVRTVSNTNIIAPVRTVSNTSIIAPVRTVSNTSIIAIAHDDTANPTGEARGLRGRGKRAYSDIFFEMAKPEQVLGSHSLRHTHQRLNGKLVTTTEIIPDPEIQEKYGMYKSPTKPPKPQKSCTETCSYVIGKFLSGFKYFLKCLLHGLYEILVFGPPTEHHEDAQEDGQDDEARVALQKDLSSIFLFGNADFYFRAIELSLLLQCVYIALWCTNFVQIAKYAARAVKWEMFLVIPIPLNFFLLKQILNFACVLRSAIVLDEEIAIKICEDALDERVVTQRLRKMVRQALIEIETVKANWTPFLREVFYHYVPDNKPGVSPKQFTLFLHGIQIHISKKSVHRIFKVIDFDQSGFITWTEFSSVVFPELFGSVPGKKSRIDALNISMQSVLNGNGNGTSQQQILGRENLDYSPSDLTPKQVSFYNTHNDHSNSIHSHSDHSDVSQHSQHSLTRGPVRQGSGSKEIGPSHHVERERFVSFSEPKRDVMLPHDFQDRSHSTTTYPNDRMVSFSGDTMGGQSSQQSYSEYYDEDGSVLSDGDLDDIYHHADDAAHAGDDDDAVRMAPLEKIEECEEENEED